MNPIDGEKKLEFGDYAAEFENEYLLEKVGQEHLSWYIKDREQVSRFWEEIKRVREQDGDVTDLVLTKLLPYSNNRHNREMGHRICVTPAITKDLKKWFENVGWQTHDNWPNVAEAIYGLYFGIVENDNWDSLAEFENNVSVSRGFKAGFITPSLYALRPELRIINNKTIDTVNFLLEEKAIWRDLTNYLDYVRTIDDAIEELSIPLLQDNDVFDAFCHWMCDKRLGGYARHVKSPLVVDDLEPELLVGEEEDAPQNHWEAIYYIVKAGNLLGYKTYVADPSKIAFDVKLSDIATLSSVPPILESAPEVGRIDAIWYRPRPPFFFFEVEDKGTMRDALHRLYNAMPYDGRFYIVSPENNRGKFSKWAKTAPFKEFEDRYLFRTFDQLFEFYQSLSSYKAIQERFLKV